MSSRFGSLSCCILLIAMSDCFVFGQEHSPEAIRSGASKLLKQLEACPAFRVQADVEIPTSKGEVRLEVRNNSYWIEREDFAGKSEEERSAAKDFHRKLMEAAGGVGKRIDAFNGSRSFAFDPARSEMTIETKSVSHPSVIAGCLYPESWICFNMSYNTEFMRFSNMLAKGKVQGVWRENERVMRFADHADPGIDAWKDRWIDVDPANGFTVVRYYFGGGKVGSWSGEFKWHGVGSEWFVEQGTINFENSPTCKWSIREFSTDAKKIRSSFKIQDESVPFGTRVNEKEGKKTLIRFVGGEKGKVEYDLRKAAITNLRLKK